MSHFTVLVCVSKDQLEKYGDLDEAVSEMMAPYQENNMGTCPQEYLKFNDTEDEYREDYKGESDEVKKEYDTFDKYMSDYCGCTKDPETGRYGYWENPNRKWDYWRIGGRWSGHFYVKPEVEGTLNLGGWDSPTEVEENVSDVCKISDLDMERIEKEMIDKAEKFWEKYAYLREHGKEPGPDPRPFYGARSTALDLGLCDVVKDPEEGKRLNGFRWGQNGLMDGDERANWYDVYNQDITREEFMKDWRQHFCPIRTYAALDEDGWHEPGRMGWFGCSSADSESRNEYSKTFMQKFILERDPDTTLVVCDCHI